MGMVITAIAIVFLFAAFIIVGAVTGLLVGSLLVSLTVALIVLATALLIAGLLALIFRIREGAYGR